jgi:glycosyltransferase involved in cell wall biosynthesis
MQPLITIYYTHKPGGLCKRLYRLTIALKNKGLPLAFYTLDPHLLPAEVKDISKKIPFPLTRRSGAFFWVLFSLWLPIFIFWSHKKNSARSFVFNPYYGLLLTPLRTIGVISEITFFYRSIGSKTYTARGMHFFAWLVSVLERLSVLAGDRLVAQTKTMKEELSKGVKKDISTKWHILPNDAPKFEEIKPLPSLPPLTCITIGKFDEGKNLSLLIEVFKNLPEAKLLIVGEGKVLDALKKISTPNISFYGWQADVRPFIEQSHILLHPSINEGMSNAILEALALERVVLASDTPENRELLEYPNLLFSIDNHLYLLHIIKAINSNQLKSLQNQCISRKISLTNEWETLASEILV